ncbi:hypothetical protein TW95_gp1664 [Pandoravirus inopinatum]|uniref:Uncharacterized protein n=1 Tax=Pandoravirus inopinatum TaxID=1605721 RepID=A0A0B5IZN9_9VIRU|nr:hypothetical protein TW95_gp1664 [Pandoravirus inopinatum]AJF98398.1 hypothetical protein [Pandoravirus inopinatum]
MRRRAAGRRCVAQRAGRRRHDAAPRGRSARPHRPGAPALGVGRQHHGTAAHRHCHARRCGHPCRLSNDRRGHHGRLGCAPQRPPTVSTVLEMSPDLFFHEKTNAKNKEKRDIAYFLVPFFVLPHFSALSMALACVGFTLSHGCAATVCRRQSKADVHAAFLFVGLFFLKIVLFF